MARITWQNVEAPRMSLYDYSQMNQTLNSAFRNLGDSITGIQEGHRDRVIDRNVGNLMRINDLDQLRSASANYGGPYARQVLEAAQAREKFLREGRQADLTYDTGVETLAQSRAVNSVGQHIADATMRGTEGQRIDDILAGMTDEQRARAGGLVTNAWVNPFENRRTHDQNVLEHEDTSARGWEQLRLARDRHRMNVEDRANANRVHSVAMEAINQLPPTLSPEQSRSEFFQLPAVRELVANGYGQQALEAFDFQYQNTYGAPRANAYSGELPELQGRIGAAEAQIEADKQSALHRFDTEHPHVRTAMLADELRGEGQNSVTHGELVQELKDRGMWWAESAVTAAKERTGLSDHDVAAWARTNSLESGWFETDAGAFVKGFTEYANKLKNSSQDIANRKALENEYTKYSTQLRSEADRLGRVANRNNGNVSQYVPRVNELLDSTLSRTDPRTPTELLQEQERRAEAAAQEAELRRRNAETQANNSEAARYEMQAQLPQLAVSQMLDTNNPTARMLGYGQAPSTPQMTDRAILASRRDAAQSRREAEELAARQKQEAQEQRFNQRLRERAQAREEREAAQATRRQNARNNKVTSVTPEEFELAQRAWRASGSQLPFSQWWMQQREG